MPLEKFACFFHSGRVLGCVTDELLVGGASSHSFFAGSSRCFGTGGRLGHCTATSPQWIRLVVSQTTASPLSE